MREGGWEGGREGGREKERANFCDGNYGVHMAWSGCKIGNLSKIV